MSSPISEAGGSGSLALELMRPSLPPSPHGLDDAVGVGVLGCDSKRTTGRLQALGSLDENVEAGRVDEALSRELDEDVSVAGSSGVVEHALKLRRRVKVDFAPDGHEASAVCECLHGDRERGAELSGAEGAIDLGSATFSIS
jgi:hypothetical protein